MKRNIVLLITLFFSVLLFSSYEEGPAHEGGLNRTGSAGSLASCGGGGCHAANNSATIVSLKVTDASGTAVTSYTPGGVYTVAINGNHTTSAHLSRFGFQVSGVLANSAQAGTFTSTSTSTVRIATLSGLQIAEHKKALKETSTNVYSTSFKWTAPAKGSGNIYFYGILNAIQDDHGSGNNNDDDDDNDDPGLSYPNIAPVLILYESGSVTTSVASDAGGEAIKCYPNPFTSRLLVETDLSSGGFYSGSIFDMSGREVMPVTEFDRSSTINTEQLPSGTYILRINGCGSKNEIRVMKK